MCAPSGKRECLFFVCGRSCLKKCDAIDILDNVSTTLDFLRAGLEVFSEMDRISVCTDMNAALYAALSTFLCLLTTVAIQRIDRYLRAEISIWLQGSRHCLGFIAIRSSSRYCLRRHHYRHIAQERGLALCLCELANQGVMCPRSYQKGAIRWVLRN